MKTIGRRLERLHEQQGLYISESAKSALSLFGLSEYDVKAYCALLELGPSTASELAIRSLVPYSKIYEVLGGLRKKGWVESYTARPTRFFPVSPGHAFAEARMRDRKSTRLNSSHLVISYAVFCLKKKK